MNTITLKHPVTVETIDYKKLTLRRPKVRDMLAADKSSGSDAEKEVTIFCNLCEVSPAVIEELDLSDYKQLQDKYSHFLS